MAEKRKYCDNNNNIEWIIDDNNVIEILSNWDTSLVLQCPNGMIINSIHFDGTQIYSNINDTTSNLNNWRGIDKHYSVVFNMNGGGAEYYEAETQCINALNSDLISIHSEIGNNEIYDIVSNFSVQDWNFWIGLNDAKHEQNYVWRDGSSLDFTAWTQGAPENIEYCKKHFIDIGNIQLFCQEHGYNGDSEDGIIWSKNGWDDYSIHSQFSWLCKNPDVNFQGIEQRSSFIHSIKSIQCVSTKRASFVSCQDFEFTDQLFGNHKLNSLQFMCQNASKYVSGYSNSAWFLQGFIFADTTGKLSDLIGIKCCYISGTVYNNNEYENPESISNIPIYGHTTIASNDNQHKFAIKNILRGGWNNIQGFTFDGITDYETQSCADDYCKTSRVQIVDYEIFTDREGIMTPNINTDQLVCKEGCDPMLTTQCINEYEEDTINNHGNANPFTSKFKCSNINFTQAIMDSYEQCEIYPVYPALFYDYDSQKHEEMVIHQLSPYLDAFGSAVIKLWHTFFIFIILKMIVFPLYFIISQIFADKCCNAIRKRNIAKVNLTLKLNDQQYEKRLLQYINNDDDIDIYDDTDDEKKEQQMLEYSNDDDDN
eukprot:224043_1